MTEEAPDSIRELLTDALSLWWLRPENGLALASYCLRGTDLVPGPGERAADFACGDGVNTFFKNGGRFDPAFDIFGDAVKSATSKEIVEQKIDVFDHADASYCPAIAATPERRYAFGTDHKAALLDKARKLSFYDTLLEADLRDEADIPDASLDLSYCNSLYWIPDAEASFASIAKKVKPGGRLIFDVMTEQRSALSFDNILPDMPSSWRDLLNRGRQHNNPGIRSEAEWDKVFHHDGMTEVVDKRDIFPTAIAAVWNVGLRPIFPVLNRMAQAIEKERRLELKAEWVETFADLLEPILREPDNLMPSKPAVRIQYVMTRI